MNSILRLHRDCAQYACGKLDLLSIVMLYDSVLCIIEDIVDPSTGHEPGVREVASRILECIESTYSVHTTPISEYIDLALYYDNIMIVYMLRDLVKPSTLRDKPSVNADIAECAAKYNRKDIIIAFPPKDNAAFELAVMYGSLDVMKYILEVPSIPRNSVTSAFLAVSSNRADSLQLLLSKGMFHTGEKETLIDTAIFINKPDIVKVLCRNGTSLRQYGIDDMLIKEENYTEIFRLLNLVDKTDFCVF